MGASRKNSSDRVTIDINKMQLTMTQKEADEFRRKLSSSPANDSQALYPQTYLNPSLSTKPRVNPTEQSYNKYIQHAAEIRANILSLNEKLQKDIFLKNQFLLQQEGKLVLEGPVTDSSATTEYQELMKAYEALYNKYVDLQTNAAKELNIDTSEIEQIKQNAGSENQFYPTFQQMYEQERQKKLEVINAEVKKLKEEKNNIGINFKARTGTSYQKMYDKLYDLTSQIAPIPITVPLAIGTVIVHGIDFLISKIRQAAKSVSIASAEKKAAKEIQSLEETFQKKVYSQKDTQFKQTFFQLAQTVNSCQNVKLRVPEGFTPSMRKS